MDIQNKILIYFYFLVAAYIAYRLVFKADVKHKVEHFFLSFYLLTGSINNLLKFKIGFFDIQPQRFLFFLFVFFLCKEFLYGKREDTVTGNSKLPLFQVFLIFYIVLSIVAQIYHVEILGLSEVISDTVGILNFLVILFAVQRMASLPTIYIIGQSIIICAIVSTLISIVQIGVDPMFMRVGQVRDAFGDVMRSNGLFRDEIANTYTLIVAIGWVLITYTNVVRKYGLVALFCLGILTTFHRMSWIVLGIILLIYFLKFEKLAIDRTMVITMASILLLLGVSIVFGRDIMNSTVVKERLSDSVDGRKGYYSMVINHIGEKPLFGFGNRKNEVYYTNMLRVTRSQARATGEAGGVHNGYFNAMFFNGIPVFLFMALFIWSAVIYFYNLSNYYTFFAIPLFMGIIYGVGNLTNTILITKTISVLFAVHLGLGLGVREFKGFFSSNY